MAALMAPAGFFLAPMLAATFSLIGHLAPPGTVTEAFAWLATLFTAGESVGAAIVGPVLDRGDLHWAAACASLGAAVCLLLVIAGYRLVPARRGSPGIRCRRGSQSRRDDRRVKGRGGIRREAAEHRPYL
jgi:MFS family permease